MGRLLFSLLLSFALVFSAAGHLAMASTASLAAPHDHAAMHGTADAAMSDAGSVSDDGTATASADPWNCCQPSPGAHGCAVDTGLALPAAAMPLRADSAPSYVRADDQAFGRAPAIPLKPPRAA